MNRLLFSGLLLTIGSGFTTVGSALSGMGSEISPLGIALPTALAFSAVIADRLGADGLDDDLDSEVAES